MAGIGAVAITEVGMVAIAGITVTTTTTIAAGGREFDFNLGLLCPLSRRHISRKPLAHHTPARVPCGCRVSLSLASSRLLP
jgi:hypothetical protein